ncbi:uncharacterized protein K489DRAFT_234278 [Dissoconium aciculare CBS 342.82]|uniref:Uncharacterized protein n=1 Tax=Dissoconium aciculare CBS 342.82 TaxID=1314786 RepID=A0A6J3M2A3_9PEZI|nr:uncharacterized protein K489DRAFT_234278 [Dissoconium aciculare CBS 342.82]KAF1822150.1 hypothetical protein K489DRAFT_234278 [Dissoconium aciculare CBS 342.82]
MCGRSQFAFSCFSRFHLRFSMLRECLILSKPRLRNTVSTILQKRLESLLRLPLNSLFLCHKSLASCRVSFPTISDAIEVTESHTGGAVLGASLFGTSPIKQRGTIFAPVKSSQISIAFEEEMKSIHFGANSNVARDTVAVVLGHSNGARLHIFACLCYSMCC